MSELKVEDIARVALGVVCIGLASYLVFSSSGEPKGPQVASNKKVESQESDTPSKPKATKKIEEPAFADPAEKAIPKNSTPTTRSVIKKRPKLLEERYSRSDVDILKRLEIPTPEKKIALNTTKTEKDLEEVRIPIDRPIDDDRPIEESKVSTVPEEKLFHWEREANKPGGPTAAEIEHQNYIIDLLNLLVSEDPYTHIEAGVALRNNATQVDIPIIANELKLGEQKDDVLLFLIETLQAIGPARDSDFRQKAFEALVEHYEHGSKSHYPALVKAIGAIEHIHSVPFLARIYKKTRDLYLRRQIILALGRIPEPEAALALRWIKTKAKVDVAKELKIAEEMQQGSFDADHTDEVINPGKVNHLRFKGTPYYFYRPAKRMSSDADPLLLVCIHDGLGEYKNLFKLCVEEAKEHGFAVLAPHFDSLEFPEYASFNLRHTRADIRLWEMIDFLDSRVGLRAKKVGFFGAAEGGSFVYRLAMAYPQRILRAAFVVPQYINTEDKSLLFPKGLRVNPFAPEIKVDLREFVKIDLLMMGPMTSSIESYKFFKHIDELTEQWELPDRIRKVNVSADISTARAWTGAKVFLFSGK